METKETKAESFFRKAVEVHSSSQIFNTSVSELSEGMGKTLFYLEQKKDNDVTASEIAEHLGVSQARVTKIINKLEVAGLVVKRASKVDGRSTVIKNTEEGSKRVYKIYGEIIRYFDYLIDKIGEKDLSHLFLLLNRIKTVTEEYGKE
ncbi:MAG: winged helix-turn-helix transcriptional regulator [Clostridia bacterium]|nr:winged helix-turn-helix transcriptional regulator [Clostridia bacterium]MBQ7043025.1 winged helix-turn-helix transcriptional regulator [Clostridia bacterium]